MVALDLPGARRARPALAGALSRRLSDRGEEGLLTGPALRAEINQKPEEIWIDWDEAVSTWPGRVSVKNLRIRGSDPNVEWIVILPEASLRYSLMPLLRRRLHRHAAAAGVHPVPSPPEVLPGKVHGGAGQTAPADSRLLRPAASEAEDEKLPRTRIQPVHFRGPGRRHGRLRRHLGGLFPLPRALASCAAASG